ncbi:MAG: DUF4867 family protein [Eubacteriales bacterium]|nr:DUF4867 family protein [Eubacteriales bacterium]
MKIYKITDPEFAAYGRIIEGYDVQPMLDALNEKTPCPEDGPAYVAEDPNLQNLPLAAEMTDTLFGGLPAEFGWCNGHNTKLNCLEYHRGSEFNLGTEDWVMLLAKESDIDADFKLDTSTVKAFLAPKGVLVEVYGTSLHYAPCQAAKDKGFRVLVVLAKGTNVGNGAPSGKCPEDRLLFATNKWLIAHPDAAEASNGAFVGLVGENIDIADDI